MSVQRRRGISDAPRRQEAGDENTVETTVAPVPFRLKAGLRTCAAALPFLLALIVLLLQALPVAVWRRFLHDYPDSKDGDRAAMYIGAIYLWSDRPEQAIKAFNEYLEQRPGARFTRTVRELLSQAEERIDEKPGGGRPRRQ